MTEQEKELLLKDLCARLSYGVKIYVKGHDVPQVIEGILHLNPNVSFRTEDCYSVYLTDIKPYLRPLSSMTEEEKRELSKKYFWGINCGQIEIRYHSDGYWDDNTECPTSEYLNLFDWLNASHFDYRGLIEKGLALEAPEEMYQ